MQLAEIKVSYTNQSTQRQKIMHSKDIYKAILPTWNLETIEYIEESKIILLNRANEILGVYELSKGGISGTVVDIRVILGVTLKCNASALVLIHNHPSGNLQPSEPDKGITTKLREACMLLDLALLDHLIISKEYYYSFADNGTL
ncbi:JAB domain-containing protein [Flavobacterium sp. NRK1]|uniref:JAB domain-containing protein n=1 Tax=Flavobacterium sp. NRK1 TaxID=2954929 RepID=UPI002093E426|nr:JAB domain-containing protein [Flavobacterium sp. NRK1]MCO6147388.1 DNA repair protein [Flavobacterium sp. NRK1]